ncbi:sugar ABC transporter substrate-binding protein [Rossellomorea marisflavi]|uniref:sugar ABC transporter substrate-binding protein n=1 Tax=Rossellomorea marisflavi TaxID=189381 RepID=UPI003458F74F
MRKIGLVVLCVGVLMLCHLTFLSAKKVFLADEGPLRETMPAAKEQRRLVLITQDTQTPFWDQVATGAKEQAKKEGVSLEVWGTYGKNEEEFLKNIEIAIQSKVDGILIQGMDTPEFKELTKVKASFNGIPVITVANDVPMSESLRRTYIGSDPFEAGKLMADALVKQMGDVGKVVLMVDAEREYNQNERIRGIRSVLDDHPSITIVEGETGSARDQIITATREVMNREPDVDAFISVNAGNLGAMIEEISKRSQEEGYLIYSFDDGPESMTLLAKGKINAVVEQEPERMGEWSVQLMEEWLNGETVPLDPEGYITNVKIVKGDDR